MAHKQRDLKKEALWRRQIRGQARSGMTVRAWCLNEQVSEATFHWWRRELARRDGERQKSAVPKCKHRRVSRSPAFVPVRVSEEDPPDVGGRDCRNVGGRDCRNVGGRDGCDVGGSRIEIVLADGRCVRVSGSVDRQMLADVLAMLTSASTVTRRRMTGTTDAIIHRGSQSRRWARSC